MITLIKVCSSFVEMSKHLSWLKYLEPAQLMPF
jgi:hypothetical protein